MTTNEIKTILSPLVETYIDHVSKTSIQNLPFIVILEMDSQNTFADNTTYKEIIPMQIILHQAQRDSTLEASIKEALTDNHIPYETSTQWDNDNLLYATTFDING